MTEDILPGMKDSGSFDISVAGGGAWHRGMAESALRLAREKAAKHGSAHIRQTFNYEVSWNVAADGTVTKVTP